MRIRLARKIIKYPDRYSPGEIGKAYDRTTRRVSAREAWLEFDVVILQNAKLRLLEFMDKAILKGLT
jgi:hypothetical protein